MRKLITTSMNIMLDIFVSNVPATCPFTSRVGTINSITAREVNFGMPVISIVSAEQRTIEAVGSIDTSHSGIRINFA